MFKKIFILSILLIAIITFNSLAIAGLSIRTDVPDALQDTPIYFNADFDWNPEVDDTWEYFGTNWNSKVTLNNCDILCNVTWEFQHIYAPHPAAGETSPGPWFSQNATFDKDATGVGVDEQGLWTHTNGTDSEEWNFSVGLDELPENNNILFQVTHAPEPISSVLFIVGGATLGLRRFWKNRKKI